MSAVETARTWGRMVKFSHSVFALPFAVASAALAASQGGITLRQGGWILVAMICARNAAMGFNRLVDHEIDARNPRTRDRELPRGRLGRASVWAFTLALAALFVFASFQLGRGCALLSPIALAVIFGYSYTKRFTWASHLVLGLGLGLAPIGAWLAVRGTFEPLPFALAAGVVLWVAGFDVIYACQDVEFDRRSGLHSIPARFGLARALWIARLLHAGALAALAAVGWLGALHPAYWAGWVVVLLLFLWEHRLVRADDLSRLSVAFFNMNGIIAVVYMLVVVATLVLPAR